MNSRFKEMNDFIASFGKIIKENPNFPISADMVYYYLSTYGCSPQELSDRDISYMFQKWQTNFSDKNLNVYQSELQPGFLQFNNVSKRLNIDCAKLYLSFPKDMMEACVNIIFDYIEKNNMPTVSKVAGKVRSDSIVLRMYDPEDAKKIIDFVSRTPVLRNNIRKPNPFIMRSNNVGMAADDMLSYNDFVSMILSDYLNFCQYNKIENINLDGLVEYSKSYFEQVFVDNSELEGFLAKEEVQRRLNRFNGNVPNCLANYCQIMMLFRTSIDKTKTEKDYFNHLALCNNYDHKTRLREFYREKVNNQEKENVDPLSILDSYIEYAKSKYNPNDVYRYLEDYLRGNDNAITRDNNYRELFRNYLPQNVLMSMTNGNLCGYISHRLKDYNEKANLTLNALIATYEKYGYSQTVFALRKALTGDYNAITNGPEQYREQMRLFVSPEDVLDICGNIIVNDGQELTNNIDEQVVSIIQVNLINAIKSHSR